MYISLSDETGGDEAEEAERETMRRVFMEISQDFCKSEFIQKILEDGDDFSDRWTMWKEDVSEVPQDCTHFIDDLNLYLDEKDLRSFKDTLMDIAHAVAMSYQEDNKPRKRSALSRFIDRLSMGGNPDLFDHPNISKPERKALFEIARALDWEGLKE